MLFRSNAAVRRFFPLPDGCAVDLARLLHARATGHALPEPQRPLAATCDALAAAIEAAGCVAFVTSHRDAVGLAAWSLAGLVRAVSGRRAAFEVPLDPAVVTGRLPNGVTYLLRRNAQPRARISLRLTVKAGSTNEADDQQGLAHLVEHLLFMVRAEASETCCSRMMWTSVAKPVSRSHSGGGPYCATIVAMSASRAASTW